MNRKAKWPWVRGDIRSFDDCSKAVEGGFDAVQHLAAQPWPTDHPRQQERREREDKAREYSRNYHRLLEIFEEMTLINMRLLKLDTGK